VRVAIVGTGIAGNVVAGRLCREHELTVFESGDYVGGHTHTHDVTQAGQTYRVDTGFIVYNDWTYPNFIRLLDEIGVASQPSSMSFSVRDDRTGLEYNGTSLDTLFAQRRNLLRPIFWRMLRDILRFNREAPGLLSGTDASPTLGVYLAERGYSTQFVEQYIVPMGAAIWSTAPEHVLGFPAVFFVRFFHNHGMLSVDDRPQWRVIRGGSSRYVEALVEPFRDRIRLRTPVEWIRRLPTRVLVKARGQEPESFDAAFLACHSDQALSLLADRCPVEEAVLGAIPYQPNQAVLHTDASLMPKARRAWAAWNYRVPLHRRSQVTLTYNMNILQSLDAPEPFLVSLNAGDAIDPQKIIKRVSYAHPLFTPAAVAAQARHRELNGMRRTYFCGAYWRNGFHEDGVVSALDALQHFSDDQNAQRALYRAG
jgi:predicted NAD/FAD-binding protein